MSRSKININKKKLFDLYCNLGHSPKQIGKLFGCSSTTILNRLVEYGISKRSSSQARSRYTKLDFNGSVELKAYMLGFALGDLNVYLPPSLNTETVVVRCHTTKRAQVDVVKELFEPYGGVRVSYNQRSDSYHINCFLNRSFDFLLGKGTNYWEWVTEKFSTSLAFATGYIDAEGSYGLNQGRARFSLTSYDSDVLRWMSFWLTRIGISNKLRLLHEKGTERRSDKHNNYVVWNGDCWRLNINIKSSLYRFILLSLPYTKHRDRKRAAQVCKYNIDSRTRYV
jgi:intein-encoded DNA endonuclease-like protein